MAQWFDKHTLQNGMVVLGEPMEGVNSVAFDFMIPAGAAVMPEGTCGAANIIEDWIFRGAGEMNSRQLSDAMDSLGLHRSSSIGSHHFTVGAALESSNVEKALELHADIILRPLLDNDQFNLAKQLAADDLHGLDDDPRQKVMVRLKEEFYPKPLGISTHGHAEDLKSLTTDQCRKLIGNHFNLSDTIFAIAGKYDFDRVVNLVEKLFGGEDAKPKIDTAIQSSGDYYTHLHHEGAQVHIGVMTPTVTAADENYYNIRTAVSVLSGGMSARLFTEVREKRGLCYAVGARYHSMKEAAGISCYAGTTPDKAQQTLDVIMTEFNRLKDGISEEEMQRAKTGLKSALILQSESSSSRAAGIGSDYYMFGRIRSLDEIKEKIEQTTAESVVNYLRQNSFKDFWVVTIGPKQITIG
ncbi:MAG: pitrilysin family protein [Phycisphaerae bacterium]|nr:pitrilysin family protein [Phycisphaerae bacterium]